MKVLHVITGLGRGGAERMLFRLTCAAPNLGGGLSHSVATFKGGVVEHEIRSRGISVTNLSDRGLGLAPARLVHLVAKERPDVVHAWMYHAALAAILLPNRVPIIVGIRQSLDDIAHEKVTTRAVIRALGYTSFRAGAVVYASSNSQRQHEALGYSSRNSTVIPNGYDFGRLLPDLSQRIKYRAEYGYSPQEIVFVNIARWHPVKNHIGLIEAFGRVARSIPNARLLLVGDGVDASNQALNNAVLRSNLQGRVLMLGGVSDVVAPLLASDCFVLPSHSEAFPNALVEAMAMELPVATTDVGDARYIVGDRNFVVPPRDTWALAGAMEKMGGMCVELRHALGVANRRSVASRFDLTHVAEHYRALYSTLCRTT